MKLPSPKRVAAILMLLLLLIVVPIGIAVEWDGQSGIALQKWELKWDSSNEMNAEEAAAAPDEDWTPVTAGSSRLLSPEGISAAWLRFPLPETAADSALLIDKVYGETLKAYRNNVLIYNSMDMLNYNGSKVLIPLSAEEEDSQLYLWYGGGSKPIGVEGNIRLGSYDKLVSYYVKKDLVDIIIGAALLFAAAALMVCLLFFRVNFFSGGFWLMLMIFSLGVLLITYSPFLSLIMHSTGRLFEIGFDLALFTLLPSFTLYFERTFGAGRTRVLTFFRNFQVGYSVLCLGLLILNTLLSFRLDPLYRFMSLEVIGILIIVQFVYLLVLAVHYAFKGNREAAVFSVGFAAFAIPSLAELILYFNSQGGYRLYWWKWGMIVFIISLIVILGRKFARNYEQNVENSRNLEKFNDDLQRSEKMEMISELAASVAHEVRNPLQVTRGFLQILGERSGKKEKEYLEMAMEELDRASVIITDFLTLAKPGSEKIDVFGVSGELKHVAGILVPLANLQGGTIELQLQDDLEVRGSSSKFKQAFINLIKNSIESLQENGLITVTAWKSEQHILISVQDNGEGMKLSELARLGEPYYSNKTKGTGLGLMVTFRIIEAMNGSIQFHSKKGEGTEVIVKLPASGNN